MDIRMHEFIVHQERPDGMYQLSTQMSKNRATSEAIECLHVGFLNVVTELRKNLLVFVSTYCEENSLL